jgi:aryl-alcohol dehydrogenase-like predicted oxidoreductase
LPTTKSIGAALVCWSPLGAGFLTGTVKELDANDFRNNNPKMQGYNFSNNLQRLEDIRKIASDLNITSAQLALAWLIVQSDNIIPIPGSRKISRINENLAALDIQLDTNTLQQLDAIAPIGAFKGATLV